jgi:hypothetical protein
MANIWFITQQTSPVRVKMHVPLLTQPSTVCEFAHRRVLTLMRVFSILTAGSSRQTHRAAGAFLWLSGFNTSRSITRDTGLYYPFPRPCLLLDVDVISSHPFNHIHGSTSNLGRKWGQHFCPEISAQDR